MATVNKFHKRRINPEILFLSSALIILTIFIVGVVFILRFLLIQLDSALSVKDLAPSVTVTRFNIRAAEELKLGK